MGVYMPSCIAVPYFTTLMLVRTTQCASSMIILAGTSRHDGFTFLKIFRPNLQGSKTIYIHKHCRDKTNIPIRPKK